MTLIGDVLLNLRTLKDVIVSISKKSRLRRPVEKKHGKQGKALFKTKRKHLYHIY